MKIFYFKDDDGSIVLSSHFGRIEGARSKAKVGAKMLRKNIHIFCNHNMNVVDIIYYFEEEN